MRNVDPYFRSGLFCAVAAHTLWGLLPLYWRLLYSVPALQLVCHRILWSFVLLVIVVPLLLRRDNGDGAAEFRTAVRSPRAWAIYALASLMIGFNWFAFVWAVTHDRVLEASLGYYINPLLNVLLGVAFLGERLRMAQWTAVGVAAVGVGVMAVLGGGVPWVALMMATSFAIYGLVKKKAPLSSLTGLLFETVILVFPALAYVAIVEARGDGAMGQLDVVSNGLLIAGGFVTVLPLALFAVAARRVPLSTIGLLQYVGPTLQFFVGAVLLGEPFEGARVIGFVCVWAGLLLYLFSLRRPAATEADEELGPLAEPAAAAPRGTVVRTPARAGIASAAAE